MTIEAMKQMVEALEMPCKYWNKTQFIKVQEALEAGRKAIAEAETKPVKVSVNEFMMRVEGNEDLIGKPFIWTEWPTKK